MKTIFEQDVNQYIKATIKEEFTSADRFNFEYIGERYSVHVDFYYDRAWNILKFTRIQEMWNKLENSNVFPTLKISQIWVDETHITIRIYLGSDRKSIFAS